MTTKTEWPTGVIARYLTVGGATADVIDSAAPSSGYVTHRLSTTCTGCPWEFGGSGAWTYTVPPGDATAGHPDDDTAGEYLASVHDLHGHAQRHAEKCRAMPRPA